MSAPIGTGYSRTPFAALWLLILVGAVATALVPAGVAGAAPPPVDVALTISPTTSDRPVHWTVWYAERSAGATNAILGWSLFRDSGCLQSKFAALYGNDNATVLDGAGSISGESYMPAGSWSALAVVLTEDREDGSGGECVSFEVRPQAGYVRATAFVVDEAKPWQLNGPNDPLTVSGPEVRYEVFVENGYNHSVEVTVYICGGSNHVVLLSGQYRRVACTKSATPTVHNERVVTSWLFGFGRGSWSTDDYYQSSTDFVYPTATLSTREAGDGEIGPGWVLTESPILTHTAVVTNPNPDPFRISVDLPCFSEIVVFQPNEEKRFSCDMAVGGDWAALQWRVRVVAVHPRTEFDVTRVLFVKRNIVLPEVTLDAGDDVSRIGAYAWKVVGEDGVTFRASVTNGDSQAAVSHAALPCLDTWFVVPAGQTVVQECTQPGPAEWSAYRSVVATYTVGVPQPRIDDSWFFVLAA